MNIFTRFYAYLRYREAVRMAEEAYAETHQRHYVLPSFGSRRELIIVDRKDFRILRRKHYIVPHANLRHLADECFYCTAYADGSGALTKEEREAKYRTYLSWWKASGLLKRLKGKRT